MAIAHVQTDSNSNNGYKATVTPTSTPTEDNVLIAVISQEEDDTLTSDDGFTQIHKNAFSVLHTFSVWYKVAGASESGAYEWSIGGFRNSAVILYEFSGVDTTTPYENWSAATAVWNQTINSPAITPGQDDSMIIVCCGTSDDSKTFSFDTGNKTDAETVDKTTGQGAAGVHVGGGYELQTTAASSGTYTHTLSGYSSMQAGTFNLIPAAAGTSTPVFLNHYRQMRG